MELWIGLCWLWISHDKLPKGGNYRVALIVQILDNPAYVRGTVGKMLRIAVASACTIASTSELPGSSLVRNDQSLSPTARHNCNNYQLFETYPIIITVF